MSGHSKWSNIKRKKEKTDGAKAKVFTKIGREIAVAVKMGGGDPSSNSTLKTLIAKAKANNVPNDNIDRIIKKAMGDGDRNAYETIVYEGYGPAGVAVIVECLTDNRNRTAGEVRHTFDKFGGNLGTTGCVSFGFKEKGVFVINNEEGQYEEEKIMDDVMEAGADDFTMEDDMIEITCDPAAFSDVLEALQGMGYEFENAEIQMVPDTYVALTDEDQMKKMALLLEKLEENDDVQNVWHNWENEEDYEG
ncbi:MAG: YebC/PmpR family DNA-binding transcriptional regulator [Oscillospiraceae bacterium]|nr:YebC/PmpR family DNA-binding transcriptional regulator [Oscillospiraceae bacterium]